MSLEEIRNFVPMTPTLATSGQPTPEQIPDIAAAGYQVLVNLALATSDHAIADEGSRAAGLGMSFIHIPVVFDAPSLDDLNHFAGVMDAFKDSKVWVHCVVNRRVSAFTYLYLKHVRGVPEAEARSPVLEDWIPTMPDAWKDFLARGEKVLLARKA